MFSGVCVAYALPIIIISYLPGNIKSKFYLCLGTLILSIAWFGVGPEETLFPKTLWISVASTLILGIGASFVLIPAVPEFMELGA